MDRPEDFLVAAAADFGGRTAAIYAGETLTYEQLYRQACDLARLLRLDRPEQRVALVAENSLDYLIRYWAVLLAGGTTVEISPSLGAYERKARLAEAEPLASIEQMMVDTSSILLKVGPEATASIVFTSGTAGSVKGVLLSRANLAWITPRIAASFGLQRGQKDEVFSAFLPFCYTYGKSVVHLAAWLGAALLIDPGPPTPGRLLPLLAGGVTHLSLVPFAAELLLSQRGFCASELPELQRLTVAGGALTPTSLRGLMARFPGRVQTMYGLTEASTRVACMPPGELEKHPSSCGRPLDGVEVTIAVDGEVLVRGGNVMQGYLNDAETGFRDGWLLTGDLGSLDSKGYLTIKGRRKNMIKTMGETVNPLTVERALQTFPGVLEAAVCGIPDQQRGEALVAYLVGDRTLDTAKLKAHCARLLGRARVPTHFHFVESLPRGPSGKLRRHLLRPD